MSGGEKNRPFDRYLGNRIRLARIGIGLTQAGMAMLLNTSQSYVDKWESGKSPVKAEMLGLIAAHTKRPITWFYEGWNALKGDVAVASAIDRALAEMTATDIAIAVRIRRLTRAQRDAVVQMLTAIDGGGNA